VCCCHYTTYLCSSASKGGVFVDLDRATGARIKLSNLSGGCRQGSADHLVHYFTLPKYVRDVLRYVCVMRKGYSIEIAGVHCG
jgi:hypothetical protein